MSEERRKATRNLAAGAMLLGASEGGNALLEHDFNRHGRPNVLTSIGNKAHRPLHARRIAGKFGVWTARSTALPLAAYGAAKLIKPGTGVKDVHVGQDIVAPMARQATLQNAEGRRAVGKRDMPKADRDRLQQHRQIGRRLSIASGTMGLTALALRAPSAAGVITRRVPGAVKLKPLAALGRQSDKATRASNTLGVLAIGTGSAGSFNYAAQQKLERKQQELASKSYVGGGIGRRMHNPGGIPKNRKALLAEVGKDDRFLRQYRQNISPSAEQGYTYLKHGRNTAIGTSAANAAFAGMSVAEGVRRLRRGARGWGAAHLALAVPSAALAYTEGRKAKVWNAKMGKIKAKAYQRAAVGELGRDRVGKRDKRVEYAEAGTGAALLTAGVKGNKIFDAARSRGAQVIEANHRARVAPLRELLPVDESGRKVKQMNSRGRSYFATQPTADKAGMRASRKKAAGALRESFEIRNRRMRTLTRATGFRPRAAAMSVAMMGGTGLLWHGARTGVEKKADRHDVDMAVAGGLAGAAGYQGALYATKPIDRRMEREIAAASPSERAVLSAHRRASGVPKNAPAGDTSWLKYHRTYPKTDVAATYRSPRIPGTKGKRLTLRIPAHAWKRGMSYAQGGRSGVVMTGLAATAAGATAIAANRHHKEKASKALLRMPRFNYTRPIGSGLTIRRPRAGGVRRNAYGTISTFRGSIPGSTGR